MTSFTIQINDYQRQMLIAACRKRLLMDKNWLDKLPGDQAYDNQTGELECMIDMLDHLPKQEADSPGILHGLCL